MESPPFPAFNKNSAPLKGGEATVFHQTYSDADMDRLKDYLLEHYLCEANYWRIDNPSVFAIFNIDGYGGR